MRTITKPLMIASLIALGNSAIAQEAGDAADPAGDLSMGTPIAEGEPQEGQPYIREEFGDWALRCLRAPEGQPDPCQLYQLLMDEQGNAVAEISLFPLPEGNRATAGATIVVPLETLLTENLTMSVDGGQARQYPYTFCNRAGCVARVGFSQADIDLFKRGAEAQLEMVPAAAPEETVNLAISLSGFTAGYNASSETGE